MRSVALVQGWHRPRPTNTMRASFGALAQLGERNTGSVEVSGSIPLGSTKYLREFSSLIILSHVKISLTQMRRFAGEIFPPICLRQMSLFLELTSSIFLTHRKMFYWTRKMLIGGTWMYRSFGKAECEEEATRRIALLRLWSSDDTWKNQGGFFE